MWKASLYLVFYSLKYFFVLWMRILFQVETARYIQHQLKSFSGSMFLNFTCGLSSFLRTYILPFLVHAYWTMPYRFICLAYLYKNCIRLVSRAAFRAGPAGSWPPQATIPIGASTKLRKKNIVIINTKLIIYFYCNVLIKPPLILIKHH